MERDPGSILCPRSGGRNGEVCSGKNGNFTRSDEEITRLDEFLKRNRNGSEWEREKERELKIKREGI